MAIDQDEEVVDSPLGWVAKHIREYVATDGRKGHRWNGVHTLLLTTRGRSTGALRRTALIYGRDRERYVVVASNGGATHHPSWYLNVEADPEVLLQVGPERLPAIAQTASGQERTRLWKTMAEIWPEYDRYQTRCERQIPVVVLEVASAASPR